jgi:hypothetical protein
MSIETAANELRAASAGVLRVLLMCSLPHKLVVQNGMVGSMTVGGAEWLHRVHQAVHMVKLEPLDVSMLQRLMMQCNCMLSAELPWVLQVQCTWGASGRKQRLYQLPEVCKRAGIRTAMMVVM